MGFSLEGCKKAAFHTKNAGVEAAMNWVLEHCGDPDFSFPFVNPRYVIIRESTKMPKVVHPINTIGLPQFAFCLIT